MAYVSGIYFSNWSVYESKHFALDLQTSKLTHVFYAFLKIDPQTGAVSLSDPWADIEMPMAGGHRGSLSQLASLKRTHRSLKVIMSIGGWGTHDAFKSAMSSEDRLSTFVVTTMEILTSYKFDGIDIDWEYPSNRSEAQQLVDLLRCLRLNLDYIRPGLALTVAAPAGTENIKHLLVSEMDKSLTFWNIMCYDFAGAGWSSHTGYHSNLYGSNGDNSLNADSVIKSYISRGVPANKLVLGMPLYGRAFGKPSRPHVGVAFSKDTAKYPEIIDYAQIDRTHEVYDHKKVASFSTVDGGKVLVTYDNPQCAVKKASYVVANGLRGGFWWDSKGDSKTNSLVSAFVEGLQNELDYQLNWV